MIQVQVSMTDLYGNAYFSVETPSMEVECLKRAIEETCDEWSKKLSRQGAGTVNISYHGYRVATGSIQWWFHGSHYIRLEPADLDWIGGREVPCCTTTDHTDLSPQADEMPACCALV